jgi:transcriptional regulator with XRE-family HTH domain
MPRWTPDRRRKHAAFMSQMYGNRPPSSDPIAAAIWRARIAANLTQVQLAQRLDTEQCSISNLEHGRTKSKIRLLRRIAEATGHNLLIDLQLPSAAPSAKQSYRHSRPQIAAMIRRARMTANLTQVELAKRLKTVQGNVSNLEQGRTQPTIRTLSRIAEATGHRLVVEFRPIK